jgi:hypothetical protein
MVGLCVMMMVIILHPTSTYIDDVSGVEGDVVREPVLHLLGSLCEARRVLHLEIGGQ